MVTTIAIGGAYWRPREADCFRREATLGERQKLPQIKPQTKRPFWSGEILVATLKTK
jgi:hypothetical protein